MTRKEMAIRLLWLLLPWYISENLPSPLLKALFGETMAPPGGWPPGLSFADWLALGPGAPIPAEWLEDPPTDPFGIPPYLKPGAGYYNLALSLAKRLGIGWNSYTGSNYWSAVYGLTFYSVPCDYILDEEEARLQRVDMWNQEFRPTHVRFTHNSEHLEVYIRPYSGEDILECEDCVSGQAYELTFPNGFMFRIDFSAALPCTIDKIEFFGEKVDPTYEYGVTC